MKLALLLALVATAVGCGGGGGFFVPMVAIDSVSPDLGPLVGGTPITITGSNFTPDTTVMFADAPLVNMVIVDMETITGLTPPAPGGTRAGVLVQNASGLAYVLSQFYYIPRPSIESVSPSTGPPEGLVPVTISGRGFMNFDAGTNVVTIGGLPPTNLVTMSDSTITCVVPPGLGPANVVLTNNNGTATKLGGFRYFPPPKIDSINPTEGSPLGGTAVTITGSGFTNNAPGPNTVTFKGVPANNIVTVDDTTITCVTPARDGLATVAVTNANGTSQLIDAFLFYPKPTLASITPDIGTQNGGVIVTLTGTGFVNNFAGANTVTIGGVAATNVVVLDDATITCQTPALGVGVSSVKVTNANGSATLTDAYTSKLAALLAATGTTLSIVSLTDASKTTIGTMGVAPTAMAFHPNGTLYGVAGTSLFTINVSTAATTTVATLSTNPGISDMTFKGTRLFAAYGYYGYTYEINIATGAVTQKVSYPTNYGTWRGGLAYDGTNMYFMQYSSYPYSYVYSIDPDSGGGSIGTNTSVHAVAGLTWFNGAMYGANSPMYYYGNPLQLMKFSSDMLSAEYIGDIGTTIIAGSP